MFLSYNRKEHEEYLEGLMKEGTYQEYENAIYEMNEFRKVLEKNWTVKSVIDQADGIYYGDLLFSMPRDISIKELPNMADKIINALNMLGIECNISSLYFNVQMFGFMFTAVAIKADDGPDFYTEATDRFLIR